MSTSPSKLSLASLRAVTQKLLSTVNRLDRLVQSDEFLLFNSTSSVKRIQTTSVFSGPKISGVYTKRRDFIIYVSAPITAEHPYEREHNIQIAKGWAKALWSAGFTVFCPQANTAYMDGIPNMGHEDWLEGDFNVLERCIDAAIFVNSWNGSAGCTREYSKCAGLGIRTFNFDGMRVEAAMVVLGAWADKIIAYCADDTGEWK